MWGLTIMILCVLVYVSIFNIPLGLNPLDASLKGMGGGYLGGGLAYLLIRLLGKLGTSILLILSLLISLVMILEKSISEMAAILWVGSKKLGGKLNSIMYYEEQQPLPPATQTDPVIINPVTEITILDEHIAQSTKEGTDVPIKESKLEKRANTGQLELIYRAREDNNNYVKPYFEMLSIVESDRTVDKKLFKFWG